MIATHTLSTLILKKLWFFFCWNSMTRIFFFLFFLNKIAINAQELERKAFSSRWISNHNWNCWVDHTTSLLRKKYRINLFTDIFSSLLAVLSLFTFISFLAFSHAYRTKGVRTLSFEWWGLFNFLLLIDYKLFLN